MGCMPEETDEADGDVETEEQESVNPLDDEELLREEYEENGLTQAEIGEKYGGVTASTVSHYMKKHGIETNQTRVTDERLDDPEWLREKYEDEEWTMQEIADEVGCSDGTVMRRLHDVEDIEIRRSRGAAGEAEEAEEEDDEAEADADSDEDDEE